MLSAFAHSLHTRYYPRADSVTWNPHKSLGVPLQCSAFLTKHEGLLQGCNSTKADYLFQQDKVSYDVSYDTGDKSIQCGRLNDVFKLWLMWKKKVCARSCSNHVPHVKIVVECYYIGSMLCLSQTFFLCGAILCKIL